LITGNFIDERILNKASYEDGTFYPERDVTANAILISEGDSVIYVGGNSARPANGSILNANDLSDFVGFDAGGVKPILLVQTQKAHWSIVTDALWSSGAHETTFFDPGKRINTQITSTKLEDIRDVTIDLSSSIVLFTNFNGEVKRCIISDKPVSKCVHLRKNATKTFLTLETDIFAVSADDGTVILYHLNGVQVPFPSSAFFRDASLIGMDGCREPIVWVKDGRVLRYKPRWTIFGKGVMDYQSNCESG
jgi:hypothetical protein